MGISPEIWGPYVWGALHLVCLGAPEKLDAAQRIAYQTFVTQLPYVIPCSTCAEHLLANLKTLPVEAALDGRDSLFSWSVRLHNLVNQQLKKPTITEDEAKRHWEGSSSIIRVSSANSHKNKRSHKATICFCVVCGILLGIFIGLFLGLSRRTA